MSEYCPILGITIYLTHIENPRCRQFGKTLENDKNSQNLDPVKVYSNLNQIVHASFNKSKIHLSLDTPCSS